MAGNTFSGSPVWVADPVTGQPHPALLSHSRLSSGDINATVVKASKATVYAYHFFNNASAKKYVKLYNQASAPVPATDTPVRRLMIPAGGTVSFYAGEGLGAFTNGLAYVITGAIFDLDTTAVTAGDVAINIDYL